MEESEKGNMNNKIAFMEAVNTEFGDNKSTITRNEINSLVEKHKIDFPSWLVQDKDRRVSRGVYILDSNINGDAGKISIPASNYVAPPKKVATKDNFVPSVDPLYVPFGNYPEVRTIIQSGIFYPTYITGLSGNGKTMMVEQICAALGREMIRANITAETEEDDILGHWELVDGQTKWIDGPAVIAMKRGAILLLDEIDLGGPRLLAMQPILEGRSVLVKKTNTVVHPEPGFNIIATANTKGKGSDDGRFVGTNVMNEAMLDRFAITVEQEYPSVKTETSILNKILHSSNIEDEEFVKNLVKWASNIRTQFKEGGVNDVISTRRLSNILKAYVIFDQDRNLAIKMSLARFDDETQSMFMDFYAAIDEGFDKTKTKSSNDIIQDTDLDGAKARRRDKAKREKDRAVKLAELEKMKNNSTKKVSTPESDLKFKITPAQKAVIDQLRAGLAERA